jgi:hypothetical protein
VCGGIKEVSIKEVQSFILKTISWGKKGQRVDESGLRLVKMHIFAPENQKLLSRFDLHPR